MPPSPTAQQEIYVFIVNEKMKFGYKPVRLDCSPVDCGCLCSKEKIIISQLPARSKKKSLQNVRLCI